MRRSLLQIIYNNSEDLYSEVLAAIQQGSDVNEFTSYRETPLRVASNNARYDVVSLLLEHGAISTSLGWTNTIFHLVFGSLESLKKSLDENQDLEVRDYWDRTPLLIAISMGDIEKSAALVSWGANLHAVGRCGKTSMQYAIDSNNLEMLRWLIEKDISIEIENAHGDTPLIYAAEKGKAEFVELLLDTGANIYKTNSIPYRAIQEASSLEVVKLLVKHGDDLNDINEAMHAELTNTEHLGTPKATKNEFEAGHVRVFGKQNPEEIHNPFWLAMIKSGTNAWSAENALGGSLDRIKHPIWCYQRYGRTTTLLDDGRIIEIGGEHEDYYDDDFCIYNDVVVFERDGAIKIFAYPEADFPPTDFHSATLVNNTIYIIGRLGYRESRKVGQTPVYCLDTLTMKIRALATTGDSPGWIYKHKARLSDKNTIAIIGGKRREFSNREESYIDNQNTYELCLKELRWRSV